ncbi:hypothetical protein L9F63_023163, partial [Diploptera punctata]
LIYNFFITNFQLIMYLFRLGILCTLLSDTLVNGFTTGAAIHVFTSQIKDLLGLSLTRHEGPFNIGFTWIEIFKKITTVNLAALVITAITICILVVNNEFLKPIVRKYSKVPIPIELIVVIVGTLASMYADLHTAYGIALVGHIPTGLPLPVLPTFSLIPKVAIDSITITMVAYTIAMSMAFIFAQRQNYEVDSNQELFAQGASNVVGSFFSCMPITASLSRSLVQETVGGKTQLTSFISCIILLFVMLWIGPFFEPLPKCILASIIVVALKGMLMQAKDLPVFWKLSTLDGIVWLITCLTVVLADIDYGLFVGLGLSLASILMQAMKPYTCLLGAMPTMDIYLDCNRYKEAREIPGMKIFHYAGGLNFATRNHFKNQLFELVGINPQKELIQRNKHSKQTPTPKNWQDGNQEAKIHGIILDFSALSYIDPSGVNILRLIQEAYSKIDIFVYFTGLSGPVYEKLQKCGLFSQSPDSFKTFSTVHDAVIFTQINNNCSRNIRKDLDNGETGQQPPPGYCAPYNGKVCRNYLNGTGLVWFNISHDNAGGWLNEQITAGLWEEMVLGLKEPCRSAAE